MLNFHTNVDWMIGIAEIAAESESLLSGIANLWLQMICTPVMLKPVRPAPTRGLHGQQ